MYCKNTNGINSLAELLSLDIIFDRFNNYFTQFTVFERFQFTSGEQFVKPRFACRKHRGCDDRRYNEWHKGLDFGHGCACPC